MIIILLHPTHQTVITKQGMLIILLHPTHQTVITKQGMIFIFFSCTSDCHHKTGHDNYIVTSYTFCCHHKIRLSYQTIYYFFYWIIRSYMVVHNYWCISLLSEQITHIVSTEVWQWHWQPWRFLFNCLPTMYVHSVCSTMSQCPKPLPSLLREKTPTSIVPIYFKGVIFHVQIQILLVPFIAIPSI